MKLSKKAAIFAAALFSLGEAAYTYDRYGVQDNSMILANVEALSQDDDGNDGDDMNALTWNVYDTDCIYTVDGTKNKKASVYIQEDKSTRNVTFDKFGKASVSMDDYKHNCDGGGTEPCPGVRWCPKEVTVQVTYL